MRTVLLDGRVKMVIVKESSNAVLAFAMEDALVKDAEGKLKLMKSGRNYRFCKCCFERHIKKGWF